MLNHFLFKRIGYAKSMNYLTKNTYRQMSSLASNVYSHKFLTSNMFGVVKSPVYETPYISINDKLKIPLTQGDTVEDIEFYAKSRLSVNSLKMFTYDGAQIARKTEAETLHSLPYFKVVIDNDHEYIVISDKSFSYQNQKYELEGNVKKVYEYCKDNEMNEQDALVLSKYSAQLLDEVLKKQQWTKQEFVERAFWTIHTQNQLVSSSRNERDIIRDEYDLL